MIKIPFAGKQLQPRQICQWGIPHWHNREIVKMVATSLGESAGYIGAWHDNFNLLGELSSRDCGLMQINVSLKEIDEGRAFGLMTDSTDPTVYGPIVKNNVQAGYELYEQPGPNGGLRRWQPWVAYTSGWATFPEWWVWHQDANGNPIGPWNPTGRYVHRAIVGVSNYHLVVTKKYSEEEALRLGRGNADYFGVHGQLGVRNGYIQWINFPSKPTEPPADGIGPRPIRNSGM